MKSRKGLLLPFKNRAFEYQQQRGEIVDIVMHSSIRSMLGDDRTEIVETIHLDNLTVDGTSEPWEYEGSETLERCQYVPGDIVSCYGKTWRCLVEHDATESFAERPRRRSELVRGHRRRRLRHVARPRRREHPVAVQPDVFGGDASGGGAP